MILALEVISVVQAVTRKIPVASQLRDMGFSNSTLEPTALLH